MLSVIVVLLCFSCALNFVNFEILRNHREALLMLIDLLTEESEDEL